MDTITMSATNQRTSEPAHSRVRPALADRRVAACRVAAMGTQVDLLVVDAPTAALAHARARLATLEARWSRFRPDSEISALNRAAGQPVAVSPETLTLVTLAAVGWQASGGRFDPTVLDALEAAGYDRSFQQLARGRDSREATAPLPAAAPGLAGITLDTTASTVTLPAGTRFDPGGIGKGYAADLLCAQLRAGGAAGACVNIGGDLRASGTPPRGGPWMIAVPIPTAAKRPPWSSPTAPPPPAPPSDAPGAAATNCGTTSSTHTAASPPEPASSRPPWSPGRRGGPKSPPRPASSPGSQTPST